MQLQRSWIDEPKKRYLEHTENLKQRKYRDLTTKKVKKFEALGYLLRKYQCYLLKTFGFFNFVEICAQTHKNLGANGTEKVLYSLFVRWYFSKPLRLLQWGGILMKLAVCSDRVEISIVVKPSVSGTTQRIDRGTKHRVSDKYINLAVFP